MTALLRTLTRDERGLYFEIARTAVGKDPHLSLARQHSWLYVPCQNSDVVLVFDPGSLDLLDEIEEILIEAGESLEVTIA